MRFSDFFKDLFRKQIIVEKIFSRVFLDPFTRKIKNQANQRKGEEMTWVTTTPRKWQNSIWNAAWFWTLPYIYIVVNCKLNILNASLLCMHNPPLHYKLILTFSSSCSLPQQTSQPRCAWEQQKVWAHISYHKNWVCYQIGCSENFNYVLKRWNLVSGIFFSFH